MGRDEPDEDLWGAQFDLQHHLLTDEYALTKYFFCIPFHFVKLQITASIK